MAVAQFEYPQGWYGDRDLGNLEMARRNLRIVTEGSQLIGICEACNTKFRSYSPVKEARQTIQSQFDAHECIALGRQPERCPDRERSHRRSLNVGTTLF